MRSLPAILVVLAAAVLAAVWLTGDPEPPLPASGSARRAERTAVDASPAGSAQDASSRSGQQAGAREAGLDHTQRTAPATEAPGIFGQALDHRGAPLVDLDIRLIPPGARGNEARWARTDPSGRFAFADVHGTFECAIWSYVNVTERVTVAPGQRKSIVLQVAEPSVLVTGTVHAGLRPVTDRTVSVHGKDCNGDVHHDGHTDQDGTFRHLLRPGTYTISVVGPPTSIAWSMKGTTIWAETATQPMVQEQLTLTANSPSIERRFVLPSARVRVQVRDTENRAIGDASVTIRNAEDQTSWSRRTDEGDGAITFDELPPGRWNLVASHAMHLPTEPKMVVTHATDDLQTVTIHMVPAGAVRVKLLHEGGLHEPLDHSQLTLHIAGRKPVRGARSEAAMWLFDGTRFEAVPVGTHELHIDDRQLEDGSIRYAPVEPIAPHPIRVAAGKTTETELAVRARPQLIVTVVGGPEERAVIQVTGPDGRVAPTIRGRDNWRAEVKAGDYTIKVVRGDRQRTVQVPVFRTEVEQIIDLSQ